MSRKPIFAALVMAAALSPSLAMAQDAAVAPETQETPSKDGWDWTFAPYLFASSVSTNLREDAPPVGNESEFSSIISKIDMAGQFHLEGQGDRFGVFGDVTYLSLSDSNDSHPLFGTSSSIDVSIVEAAAIWNVEPSRYDGVDVFAGVRHLVTNVAVEIDPTNVALPTVDLKLDQSFTDFMVGARYNTTLSGRWGLTLRADGAWGDTDNDYNLSALLRYKMGNGSWAFGYRYMDLQVSKAGQHVDIALHGPVIAYSFGF
jgi:hypothetical protein